LPRITALSRMAVIPGEHIIIIVVYVATGGLRYQLAPDLLLVAGVDSASEFLDDLEMK
jgi:hypothetical protein